MESSQGAPSLSGVSAQRIAVVEDEEDIREILEFTLQSEGFAVSCFADGKSALRAIRRERPDLVLLDLMLPDLDGLEVCRELKSDADTRAIPVVMVTAKGEETDVVLGLGLGADDYVPKPFRNKELVARVKAVLRRTAREVVADDERQITHGDLRMDPTRHKAWAAERELELTATEFRILQLLASHPGRIFTRAQILTASRGEDAAAYERSVDAHVRTVRKKLGELRDLIETVRSIGYRFAEENG